MAASSSNKLVDAVVRAAEIVGYDGQGENGLVGYLTRVAECDPRTFVPLISKAIPLTVESSGSSKAHDDVRRTPYEVRLELESMGFKIIDHPPPAAIVANAPFIDGEYRVIEPDDDDDDAPIPDFHKNR